MDTRLDDTVAIGSAPLRIGWIGLGDQGLPIVRRLVTAGARVAVWARRESSIAPLADMDLQVAATVDELGRMSDVVGVCVPADHELMQVVVELGLLAAMRPGSVLLVNSTVRAETCTDIEALAAPRGVHVVDAPITRNRPSQHDSEFALLVGGAEDIVARVAPLLRLFAEHVTYLGPLGSGQRMKVINNALVAANLRLVIDALAVGEGVGLDPEVMVAALHHASGGSTALDWMPIYWPTPRASYVRLLDKDVRIFEALSSTLTYSGGLGGTSRRMMDELLSRIGDTPST